MTSRRRLATARTRHEASFSKSPLGHSGIACYPKAGIGNWHPKSFRYRPDIIWRVDVTQQVKAKIRTGARQMLSLCGVGSSGTLTPQAAQFPLWFAEPEFR